MRRGEAVARKRDVDHEGLPRGVRGAPSRRVRHSVEARRDGALVGGLYGLSLGGAFFGESMFHRETDASKAAFATLVFRLAAEGFTLVDCQATTPHLLRLGAVEIPRTEYLSGSPPP